WCSSFRISCKTRSSSVPSPLRRFTSAPGAKERAGCCRSATTESASKRNTWSASSGSENACMAGRSRAPASDWPIARKSSNTTAAGSGRNRSRTAEARFSSRCRKFDNRQPEILDLADGADEIVQFHRLGDVAVGVQIVGRKDVLFGVGGGHDHDRDAL